jgi:hypothetical protein
LLNHPVGLHAQISIESDHLPYQSLATRNENHA